MPAEPDAPTAAAIAATTRDWVRAVYGGSGLSVPPEHLEQVFAAIIDELLDLAGSEPFPVRAARDVGHRLAEPPFDRTRMLAPATRALLGFAPGEPGSLVATRWPFVASHAIDAYAEALQQRALAQQERSLSEAVSVRVQEIAALQHRLRHEATHDALTDLANRSLLQERVRLMATDRSRGVGLLLLDLDDFKQINDGFGHAVGDEVLVEISRRLRAACPEETVVCRYGGDEFVLALPARRNTLGEVAMRVLAAMHDPVRTAAGPVPVSASVGTAFCPPGRACDFSDLLRSADRAMYSAKTAGKRRFALSEVGGEVEPGGFVTRPIFDAAVAG
ncbi:GGDEF domain-containing protein [Nocardia sp. CDC159]|uniref:GGDEF domain-containing protein n=1 Tax=Nocardia pulmonis TaxID=2951408 RepID=A0A9X2EG48_9NOCA|nr:MULTISPECIES: GGDEF domain-containing protein [Nocardia]MCM6777661.1 GGDEF domain-containing protein [Nocardia pulmonis]MCM6790535.1 GGDEF domain-containing protein [Nocardia sp. CDC159]